MKKVGVFYWSGTGNTQAMAEAIGEGLSKAGVEYDVINISNDPGKSVKYYESLIFGCPSMGSEVLEEAEFEPFFEEAEGSIGGKRVALFGSYGWGDGEWMRDWQSRVEAAGANLFDDGLIINETPNEEGIALCVELGETFAR